MSGGSLPKGWLRRSFGDLGKILKSRGGSKADEVEEGAPVIRYGELYTRHHDVVREFHSFVSEERTGDYTPLRPGDVLFAGSGETLEEIGKAAVFPGPDRAYAGGDLLILRPGGGLDPLFLGYASNSPAVVAQKARLGQGSSVMHLYAHNLQEVELPLPPLPEQKKIAAILSSVDDAIAATRKVIEQTERLKKGLLQTLMTRGIGHTRFKKTEIGEIPEGWEVVRLGDILSMASGKPRPELQDSLSVPVYGGNGIMGYSDLALVNEPTVVVGRVGHYCGVVHTTDGPAWITDNALYVTHAEGVGSVDFMGLLLRQARLERARSRSSQPLVTQGRIGALHVPLPPKEEQRSIVRRQKAMDRTLARLRVELTHLHTLKRGLLQDLLTGRVRVTPD